MKKITTVTIWTLICGFILALTATLTIMFCNIEDSFNYGDRVIIVVAFLLGCIIGGFTGNSYYDEKNRSVK